MKGEWKCVWGVMLCREVGVEGLHDRPPPSHFRRQNPGAVDLGQDLRSHMNPRALTRPPPAMQPHPSTHEPILSLATPPTHWW